MGAGASTDAFNTNDNPHYAYNKRYYCHACRRTTMVRSDDNRSATECQHCQSGFIEEVDPHMIDDLQIANDNNLSSMQASRAVNAVSSNMLSE